jgi:MoaA/NifB/PqqE/SkfB family radical SAM enzyme
MDRTKTETKKNNNEKDKNLLKGYLPDRLKKTIKETFLKSRATPKNCSLFMTNRCNFKCRGCRRSVLHVDKSKEMKLDTVKILLSLYPNINYFSIAGFGEPTLCEEFVNIVEFLKKEGKTIHIITNGTNIDKILPLKYRPDRLTISLYGYDAESYLTYTGVDAYNQVIKNFLRLNKQFKKVRLLYILTRKNYRDLDKILSLCDRLKPDFLQLINYLAYDITKDGEVQKIITVKDNAIIEYIDELCKNRNYVKEKPVYIDFEHPKFNCSSYDSRINLDGEGNIGGCLRQNPPDSSYGNIFIEKDPFNSTEMKRLRRLQHTMAKTKKPPHKECNYCFGNWYPK